MGEDSDEIVGLQADSNALTVQDPTLSQQEPYVMVNNNGDPVETKPRNGRCMKLYQATTCVALPNWNLLCLGVIPFRNDYTLSALYPTAIGDAFIYNGGYIPISRNDTLAIGEGFWIKLAAGQNRGPCGALVNNLVIHTGVGARWNLIGGLGRQISIGTIVQNSTTVTSNYFAYGKHGYYIANIAGPDNPAPGKLLPCHAYWVKTNGAGTLTLNGSVEAAPKAGPETNLDALNQITVTDRFGGRQTLYIGDEESVKQPSSAYDLPPISPGFDARFSSGRFVETYPATLDAKALYQYPIDITTDAGAYPLTVSWNVVKNSDRALVLTTPDGKALGNTVMDRTGFVHIRDAGVKTLLVALRNGITTPKAFGLGQNYPNPFNPTTHFDIEIPKTTDVSVAVYDILGRRVATLLQGQQNAGYLTVEWDGKDAHGQQAPTGIYFIRMNADEFSATTKIMLMK
jgi:hypothetical protein